MFFFLSYQLLPRRPVSGELTIAEAVRNMIIHQARRLHESITDGGSHEVEASFLEVFAHPVGCRGFRGKILRALPGVPDGITVNIPPQERVKSPVFLADVQDSPRIPDRRVYLKAPPINNMYKYARTCCGTVVHFLRFRESGKIVIWNSGTQERLGWSLPTRSTVNTMAAKTSKGHKSSPLGNSSFRPLFLSS